MRLIDALKERWRKMTNSNSSKKPFGVDLPATLMDGYIPRVDGISAGRPYWKTPDLGTINLAPMIADYVAGLICLNVNIVCPETPRGAYLQEQADYLLSGLRNNVSRAIGGCGLVFKPNGKTVDYVAPDSFTPVDFDSNGTITGAIFRSQITRGEKTYTRLEYHRFENGVYRISNEAYDGERRISLETVPEWADIQNELELPGVEKPLFSFYGNPAPNFIDRGSPLSVPIWAKAEGLLKDADTAYQRRKDEIDMSEHRLIIPLSAVDFMGGMEVGGRKVDLPKYILSLNDSAFGNGTGTGFHEHVSTLYTAERDAGINSLLSLIATQCGLSQGTFVLNEKQGIKTATEIEADEQETIRTVKGYRDALETSLRDLFHALNDFITINTDLAEEPGIVDEIIFSFQDLTYSYEEDKQHWMNLALNGFIPKWKYLVKFEGMSEEEARELAQTEATQFPDITSLFGE